MCTCCKNKKNKTFIFTHSFKKISDRTSSSGRKVYWYKYAKGNSFKDCMFMTDPQAVSQQREVHV